MCKSFQAVIYDSRNIHPIINYIYSGKKKSLIDKKHLLALIKYPASCQSIMTCTISRLKENQPHGSTEPPPLDSFHYSYPSWSACCPKKAPFLFCFNSLTYIVKVNTFHPDLVCLLISIFTVDEWLRKFSPYVTSYLYRWGQILIPLMLPFNATSCFLPLCYRG